MFEDALDSKTAELPCPGCGHKTKKTFKWLKSNTQFTCVCGKQIHIDQSQFKSELAKVEKSLADLDKTLKNLFK